MSYVHPFKVRPPSIQNSSHLVRFIKLPLLKEPVTPIQHLVYAELLHRSAGKGYCFIRTGILADAMGLEVRRVKRAFSELVGRGLIARLRRNKQSSVTVFPLHDQLVMHSDAEPRAVTLPKSLYHHEAPTDLADYTNTFEFARLPEALRMGEYAPECKVTWAAMAHYVGAKGYAVRSMEDMAGLTSLSLRRVQQVAKLLDGHGLTKRLHRSDHPTALTVFPAHEAYEHAVPVTLPTEWLYAIPVKVPQPKSVPFAPLAGTKRHAARDSAIVRYTDFTQLPSREIATAYEEPDKILLPFVHGLTSEADGIGMELHDNVDAVEAYRHLCRIGVNRLSRRSYAPILAELDTTPEDTLCLLVLNHMATRDEDWRQDVHMVPWEQPIKIAIHWQSIKAVAKQYASEALGWDVRTARPTMLAYLPEFVDTRKRHALKSVINANAAIGNDEEWAALRRGEFIDCPLYAELASVYGDDWAEKYLPSPHEYGDQPPTIKQGATQ